MKWTDEITELPIVPELATLYERALAEAIGLWLWRNRPINPREFDYRPTR